MKKLYTINHLNVTTCSDFDFKFRDFLNYLFPKNKELYEKFVSSHDFKIENIIDFKIMFNTFFHEWLSGVFHYDLCLSVADIKHFIENKKSTDERFDELFANHVFYSKLNNTKSTLFIYDISNNEEKRCIEIIKDRPLIN